MSQKKRVLFALVIAAVIVIAVFSSFAINLLFRGNDSIELPSITNTGSAGEDTPSASGDLDGVLSVDVTPETVQDVIRTLSRPESYQRTLTVALYWENGESAVTTVQVWQNGSLTRVESTPPTGLTQYSLTDGDHLYRWYANSSSYVTLSLDAADGDWVQHIPTYEDVLELPVSAITDAGYEIKEGLPCIYVSVASDNGLTDRYWISLSSGLLAGAERLQDNTLLYTMSSYSPPVTPCPSDISFALPDGTDLVHD